MVHVYLNAHQWLEHIHKTGSKSLKVCPNILALISNALRTTVIVGTLDSRVTNPHAVYPHAIQNTCHSGLSSRHHKSFTTLGWHQPIGPNTTIRITCPIRGEWIGSSEQRPGFVEIDLVGHDGGVLQGDYLFTLDMTDVYSGWTEVQAVQNKAQVWVFV